MKTYKKIILGIMILILIIFAAIFFLTKKENIDEKTDWYIKITNDYINLRKEPNQYSSLVGKVSKGEKYKVLDINLDSGIYYWYYIEIDSYTKGWIASNRKTPYLVDYNNPNDIAVPVLKFYDDIYYVRSMKDITYDHLEIYDDKDDYVIGHTVYKEEIIEEQITQYWIVYKIVDSAGNSIEKTQKIVFEISPEIDEVLDFKYYKN